jgi:hypothetical protein
MRGQLGNDLGELKAHLLTLCTVDASCRSLCILDWLRTTERHGQPVGVHVEVQKLKDTVEARAVLLSST